MAEAGHRGSGIRSDCWIRFTPADRGIKLKLTSKVAALYGKKIEKQVHANLTKMAVSGGRVEIEDQGALPYVISARLETAVRRSGVPVSVSVLPETISESRAGKKDRMRRSRLYIPGNQPYLFINAGLYHPDGIILDLEDSVPPSEKDAARVLVRNALGAMDFMGAERMVRINQLPMGLEDLAEIVPAGVQMILIPKCEHKDQILEIESRIKGLDPPHTIWLMPIIESALGCFNALEIATASNQVAAISIGLEDYTADLGVARTRNGTESLWARQVVVNAATAAGIQAIDSVFSDLSDMIGLKESSLEAKSLGFEGKACIHPNQIKVIHEAFRPTNNEIQKACAIVSAYEKAKSEGLGVVALGSKMIDAPVVKRAQLTIKRAIETGDLKKDWQTNNTPSK